MLIPFPGPQLHPRPSRVYLSKGQLDCLISVGPGERINTYKVWKKQEFSDPPSGSQTAPSGNQTAPSGSQTADTHGATQAVQQRWGSGLSVGSLHGVYSSLHGGLGILHGLPVDGFPGRAASQPALNSFIYILGSPGTSLEVRICVKTCVCV